VKHSRFTIALGLSLLLPVALIVANSIHYAERPILGSPGFLMANWLYMGFPQLLWGFLALIFGRALSRNRMPTLVALDLLLTCFQLWIWYAVPRRDGADAWILYIPLWLLVLIVASSMAWIGARHERRLRD
jgi:hypothetical protein